MSNPHQPRSGPFPPLPPQSQTPPPAQPSQNFANQYTNAPQYGGQPVQYQPIPVVPPTAYQQPVPYPQPVPVRPPVPVQVAPVAVSNAQVYGQAPVYAQPQYVPNQPVPVLRPQPVPVQPVPQQVASAPIMPSFGQANAPQLQVYGPTPVSTPVPVAPLRPVPVSAAPANVAPAQPQLANRPVPVSAARPIPVPVGSSPVVRAAKKGEEPQPDLEGKVVKSAPPWLVSLVVHMVMLIIMGLIVFVKMPEKKVELEVIYAEDIGVQLLDDKLTTGMMKEVDITDPAVSIDTIQVNDPFAAPPESMNVALDGNLATDAMEAPSIGLALSGREKGAKSSLLGAYGGNATTEAAVKLGLEWLKRNQESKGTWSLVGPYSGGSLGENRCSATSMALLAFQGAGHTPKEGEYKKEMQKAWKALLDMQDKDGLFYHEGQAHSQFYSQAQATIAICELYGMTKDKEYRAAAQKAVDYAVKTQAPEGGWRYYPNQDSDTSVTGWFVIALQSALMAGLEVPSPTFDKISKFLDSVQSENGTRYGYRPGAGGNIVMTAEALLCRQYLGWKQKNPALVAGVEFVNDNPIQYDTEQNVYYWYYATQVTHHMEGNAWKKWNSVMRQVIPERQEKTGKEAGSWSPANDRWGSHGGRLYTTCLSIYMLEVYYRHLPIYKWRPN